MDIVTNIMGIMAATAVIAVSAGVVAAGAEAVAAGVAAETAVFIVSTRPRQSKSPSWKNTSAN
jgi:hypothetical protein